MRTIILVCTSALVLTACGKEHGAPPATAASAAATPLAAGQPPARKAGLWEQTISRDGATSRFIGKMRLCVDAASEAKASLFGGRAGRGACEKRSVGRSLSGGFSFSTTCDMGSAGVMTSKGTLSGDLGSAYRVHVESVITGSGIPSMNGHHVTDIQATYLGPCPAGVVAGDVVMANGMKVNVNGVGAAAAAMAGGG